MASEVTFTETRDEIERLQREDATLFEIGGTGRSALSGEEYRQELRRALDNPTLAKGLSQAGDVVHVASAPRPGTAWLECPMTGGGLVSGPCRVSARFMGW
jgi:hypothetical protein